MVPLNDTGNTQWTATATFGTPAEGFSGQSLFRVAQTPKLIIKCTVALDSFAASTFVSGVNCTTCQGHKLFDIENSLTVFNENITSTVEVGGGNVTGAVVRDLVTIGGFKVSHRVCWLKERAPTDPANRSRTKQSSWPMKSTLSTKLKTSRQTARWVWDLTLPLPSGRSAFSQNS